jgi:signal transduction histidine kinase
LFENWSDHQRVYHDEQRISQILLNLLSNALKFTQDGTVKVTVEKHSEFFKIAVKDSGIGISEENQQKLFKLFGFIQDS